MKKYEITDIPHPDYPWLHRIRALYSFRSDVQQGQLGGYVQSEDNLSQKGTCWLFGDAIAFEDAYVSQDAVLKGNSVAKGSTLVSGTAECLHHALVCDHAIVTGGLLSGCCLAGGNAHLYPHPQTGISPVLADHAAVYGEVSGAVRCHGYSVVLPGLTLNNPTCDTISLSNSEIKVSIAWNHPSRNILPPAVRNASSGQKKAPSPQRSRSIDGDAR